MRLEEFYMNAKRFWDKKYLTIYKDVHGLIYELVIECSEDTIATVHHSMSGNISICVERFVPKSNKIIESSTMSISKWPSTDSLMFRKIDGSIISIDPEMQSLFVIRSILDVCDDYCSHV